MKSVVHAACPHDCPDACGVLITVEDGRATKIKGDPAHPVTRGFLCAKRVAAHANRDQRQQGGSGRRPSKAGRDAGCPTAGHLSSASVFAAGRAAETSVSSANLPERAHAGLRVQAANSWSETHTERGQKFHIGNDLR